jgi:hypothetical protein
VLLDEVGLEASDGLAHRIELFRHFGQEGATGRAVVLASGLLEVPGEAIR